MGFENYERRDYWKYRRLRRRLHNKIKPLVRLYKLFDRSNLDKRVFLAVTNLFVDALLRVIANNAKFFAGDFFFYNFC